jgi:hypothetical protein
MTKLRIRLSRVSALVAVLLVAFITFGCNSSPSSPSPSSSSSSQETVQTVQGASLSGTFTSAGALSSRLAAFSRTDVNDVTVEVLGTGQTAAVTNGTFFLPELPTGSFTLVFRDGTGTELGRLTFRNVQPGQKIELLLELHDQGVVLLRETRDDVVVQDNTTDDDEDDNAGGGGNNGNTGGGGNDGGNGGGGSSSFQGSLSGGWNGSCEGFSVTGRFSISIDANGRVTGSYSGDDSGQINGDVRNNGDFSAAAGSAGECRWSGDISGSGSSLSGDGTWTCPDDCSGRWDGP